MFEELQANLVTLLLARMAPLAVYGAVPQDAAYPYMVVGEHDAETADTDDTRRELVRYRLRHYRAAGAVAAAAEFEDNIRAALHRTEDLALTRGQVVTIYVEGSAVEEPADEGKARETAVTVAILISDITSPI